MSAKLFRERVKMGIHQKWYYDPVTKWLEVVNKDINEKTALEVNREGQKDTRRRKNEDGDYSIFRMTLSQRRALEKLYPDLGHWDVEIRNEAWNRFRYNPIGRPFQLTRPPGRDKVTFSSKPAPPPSIILPR